MILLQASPHSPCLHRRKELHNTEQTMLLHGLFCIQEMPAAGLEPARCCQQQILSLPRLPIPTRRHLSPAELNPQKFRRNPQA